MLLLTVKVWLHLGADCARPKISWSCCPAYPTDMAEMIHLMDQVVSPIINKLYDGN